MNVTGKAASVHDRMLAAEAVRRTFERRRTPVPDSLPIGLSDEFAQDRIKQIQWRAFLMKNKLEAPILGEVIAMIPEFWLDVAGEGNGRKNQ